MKPFLLVVGPEAALLCLFWFGICTCSTGQAPLPPARMPAPGKSPSPEESLQLGRNELSEAFVYPVTDLSGLSAAGLTAKSIHTEGIEISYLRGMSNHFNAVGDFQYTRRSSPLKVNTFTFALGPRVSLLSTNKRTVPFVQALIGLGHLSVATSPGLASATGLSVAAGGGVDFRLSRYFGVRFQADAASVVAFRGSSIQPRLSLGGFFRF